MPYVRSCLPGCSNRALCIALKIYRAVSLSLIDEFGCLDTAGIDQRAVTVGHFIHHGKFVALRKSW